MAASSIWLWKEEPLSPLIEDSWCNASDNVAIEVELTDEVKVTRAEHASKLLDDLDHWVKEEEAFPDWLEEKIDLPIFEDLPPPPLPINNLDIIGLKPAPPSVNSLDMVGLKSSLPLNNMDLIGMKTSSVGMEVLGMKQPQTLLSLNPLQYQIPPPPPALPLEQTPVLMQEFDYSMTNHDTLTPPDSPKEADLVFTMLQEMQPHELDELVRMRVESLVETPSNCVDSTRSSLHEECESVASPSSDSAYSDPDWSYSSSSSDLKVPKRRRMTKPYSRTPPEEKRLRKKEQNKNAATRYRLKKKLEVEEILSEEKQLQNRNDQLKSELTEIGREIKYLKNLMRDMLKAKGLIK